jgi:hypothetical protein
MKTPYQPPVLEIKRIDKTDILTTSGNPGDNFVGWDPN